MGVGESSQSGAYKRLRTAHVLAIRAALDDHVRRLDWSREEIERHRTARLRGLLCFARERSPFHAARIDGIDPSSATIDDLSRLPPMLKREAQREWDTIVTDPDLTHAD